MAQTLEKTKLVQNKHILIIPENAEIKEIVTKKIDQKPKKKFFKKFSKSHEKQISINRIKNRVDANIYRGGFFPR
ncbi:hypothetical protein LCGC14_1610660 [marine sediment metagenome]|uniref:Uncharacterized protein n=1 Tax=marine sediment metagenome TaxID=412755 RepID=A0A0F9KP37_9ZZZZ